MKDSKTLLVKVIQAILLAVLALLIPAFIEPAIIIEEKTWLIIVVSVLATVFQPAYSPTEQSRTQADRGTAVQIVWSIYATQFLCLIEAVTVRYPDSFTWGWTSVVAFLLMVLGLGLRSWAVKTLGRFFTWNVRVQDGQSVIRSGPYRFVRHPSYTGAFLTYFGTTLFLHAWWSAQLAIILLPLAFLRRIRHEEALLLEELHDYGAYRKEVKALIPWVI